MGHPESLVAGRWGWGWSSSWLQVDMQTVLSPRMSRGGKAFHPSIKPINIYWIPTLYCGATAMTKIDDLWLHRLVREIDKYTDNSSAVRLMQWWGMVRKFRFTSQGKYCLSWDLEDEEEFLGQVGGKRVGGRGVCRGWGMLRNWSWERTEVGR